MTIPEELFPVAETQQDSPRLRWLKKHGLETERIPEGGPGVESPETGDPIPAWVCRVKKTAPMFSSYIGAQIVGGDTEEEACAHWGMENDVPLWNEEQL